MQSCHLLFGAILSDWLNAGLVRLFKKEETNNELNWSSPTTSPEEVEP
jgi:hypothetical protein